MSFRLLYHRLVEREDIPRLSAEWREKIKCAIEDKLTTSPDLYGKPLRRSLAGYRKLRVGDYQVIFRLEGDTVKILIIQHRHSVYKNTSKRI